MEKWTTKVIGSRVRERREALGMSQDVLARHLGTRQPNVSAIEQGRAGVSLERLLKLAHLLECTPADLTCVVPAAK